MTNGAVITMARRAGRPRKQGRREPSGRLQRAPQRETEWQTMEPVLRRRAMELGLWEPEDGLSVWDETSIDDRGRAVAHTPSLEALRLARSPEAGTPWGRLYINKLITREQCDAATWFADLRDDYLRAIYAPKSAILDMEPGQRGRALVAENIARNQAVRAAYSEAEGALRASGRKPMRAVLALLFEDGLCRGIGDVRAGLDALHEARMGGVDNAREIRHRVLN